LSLLVVHVSPKNDETTREILKSMQQDVLSRLSNARIGQAIGDAIRQTDLLVRDHVGRFIVLCPETDLENAVILANRTAAVIENRTGLQVNFGVAAFPDEALTFEDLLHLARDRSKQLQNQPVTEMMSKEVAK
jgi:GGDEF domain-containing protein